MATTRAELSMFTVVTMVKSEQKSREALSINT